MTAKLKLPIVLRALGDEVRLLQDYFARGPITQAEADQRLAAWDLFYPPRFWDIELLADARKHALSPALQFAEAAE